MACFTPEIGVLEFERLFEATLHDPPPKSRGPSRRQTFGRRLDVAKRIRSASMASLEGRAML